MRARHLPFLLIVIALLASACGGKGLGTGTVGRAIDNETGYNAISYAQPERKPAPSWSGKDLNGATITSASFKGSIMVVNFWASWCVPCRTEQPALERVAQAYEDEGVRFVGVNIRDTNVNALAHVEEFAVTYPSIFNPDATIAYDYRISYPPTTFVVDRDGFLAWKIIGETREANLSRVLDIELGP
jgi:thiol-disulfide isomerase/thioredoxin